MAFEKSDDVGKTAKISREEMEHEKILVKVEHKDAELHNLDEVEKEAHDTRDRSRRVIKPPQILGYAGLISFALISSSEVLDEKPIDYKEAVCSRNKSEWLKDMVNEMKYLHDNHTWKLIKKPTGVRLISCKWIFKVKEGIE